MQIFFSHSSRQKPLIREVRKCLPAHLNPWIDEDKLVIGDDIASSLEQTIKEESDYILLFIDDHAVASGWVQREIVWALEAEKRVERTLLLPIVIEEAAFYRLGEYDLTSRKYLLLRDFLESSVRSLADAIASELFALVCRDYRVFRTPKPQSVAARMQEADAILEEQAALVQKACFPHRRANPLTIDALLRVINSQSDRPMQMHDFEVFMDAVVHRNLVPGLFYDGREAFIVEEHASWKAKMYAERKDKIGGWAVSQITNGCKVILDAGSTTETVVQRLCKRIEARALTRLSIATTSVNIADMISDCCVKMGFDDDFSAVRLFVPGGQVRPATQAIIPFLDEQRNQIPRLADALGGFDVGLLGVNGVDIEGALTTHDAPEAANKRDVIACSDRVLVLGDSSKIGISLEHRFGNLTDKLVLVTNESEDCPDLAHLRESFSDNMVVV